MSYWTIETNWRKMDAAIICGGSSLTAGQVDAVRAMNARTIVVNSAYLMAPWADLLVFADARWYDREKALPGNQLAGFKGRIVAVSRTARGENLLRLNRAKHETGLAKARDTAVVGRTSLHSALNICAHKGVKRIFLLGADNRDGENGRAHFHDEYPWPRRRDTWNVKTKQLATVVKPLADLGIEVLNCSPISALPWWPKINIEEFTK